MSQQINVQNLKSITRENNTYTARYAWAEDVEVKHALPVFTGNLKANGTVAKSATLRRVISCTKKVNSEVDVEIEADEARALCEAADAHGMILGRSVLSKTRWTAYFKD